MDVSNQAETQDAMVNRKCIHWQAKGVEEIPPNEAEGIQTVADQINAIQKAQYNMHRHCYTGKSYSGSYDGPAAYGLSGTHARTQGIFKLQLIVEDDLPKHLKQSMFQKAGKYPVVFATPASRGIQA